MYHMYQTVYVLDCPWVGPGWPSANFAGPGPGPHHIYFQQFRVYFNIFINFDLIQVKMDALCLYLKCALIGIIIFTKI